MEDFSIEWVEIEQLKPYKDNAKKHSKAQIQQLADSIETFGFQQCLVIDNDNCVVVGHGRWQAAKSLGKTHVPCKRASNLTEDEINAYRLADNQVTSTEYDFRKMQNSLREIGSKMKMEKFGFCGKIQKKLDEKEAGYFGDAREKTYDAVNLREFDAYRTAGRYQMPIIEPCDFVPDSLIGFNYVNSTEDKECGVHFFIDDYQFERIWNQPHMMIERLTKFQCALTPDFSLYMDMPFAMKIWNVYRSRLIGQMMQNYGMNVIPTLSWAEKETYDFCFDGIMQGGTVAVSTVGCVNSKESMEIFMDGLNEAVKRTKPKTIVLYGKNIDLNYAGIDIKHISARKFGG